MGGQSGTGRSWGQEAPALRCSTYACVHVTAGQCPAGDCSAAKVTASSTTHNNRVHNEVRGLTKPLPSTCNIAAGSLGGGMLSIRSHDSGIAAINVDACNVTNAHTHTHTHICWGSMAVRLRRMAYPSDQFLLLQPVHTPCLVANDALGAHQPQQAHDGGGPHRRHTRGGTTGSGPPAQGRQPHSN